MTLAAHKTKIVATLGPACDRPGVLDGMVRAGMDIARLNFSHGTFDEHRRRIEAVRAAAAAADRPVATLADMPGPKIRLGGLATEPVELATGQKFTLTTGDIIGDATRASVEFDALPHLVSAGDDLYLNDGLVQLKVLAVAGDEIRCQVTVGGEIRSRKGLNIPGIDLKGGAFTARDQECLQFALEQGVDAIGQSFVESAEDVNAVRAAALKAGQPAFVVAKIERARAVERIDEIVSAADAIMIARGDLGVESPIEGIAILQKKLMRKAMRAGKPVITATQMLESMTRSRQPTRAEATDVANAILDGTDCVMLSGESATGDYPVESVAMLARIAAATEPHRPRSELWDRLKLVAAEATLGIPDLLALSIEAVLSSSRTAAVVLPAGSEGLAARIARLRLPVWIGAFSPQERCRRLLQFSYGVAPLEASPGPSHARAPGQSSWHEAARNWITAERLPGEVALLIHGSQEANAGPSRIEFIPLSAGLA